jgi:hypothetical protein
VRKKRSALILNRVMATRAREEGLTPTFGESAEIRPVAPQRTSPDSVQSRAPAREIVRMLVCASHVARSLGLALAHHPVEHARV